MKQITNKQVEDIINNTFTTIKNKADDISKNITETDIEQKDKFLTLVDKATSFHIDAEKEIQFIDIEELGNILYQFIFEYPKYSKEELSKDEMIIGIIYESLVSDYEYKMSDDLFILDISRWLKYHVIPYIYEHKREYKLNKEIEKSPKSWRELTDKTVKTFKEQNPYNEKYQLIENLIIEELERSIVSDLFNHIDLNQILYVLISEKNLSLIDIIHNPLQIETIMNSSIIDYKHTHKNDKKVAITWLRKILIPKIFNELAIKSQEDRDIILLNTKLKEEYLKLITKSTVQLQLPEFKSIDFIIKEDSPLYKRIEKIVRDFYDSFYDISSLCLYYTYYVLKLKGNTDFDYDFRLLEDKLYNDFYNYGIFAIIGELSHFPEVFHFYRENSTTIELSDYFNYSYPPGDGTIITFKKGFKEAVTEISECIGISIEDIYKTIKFEQIKFYTLDRYKSNPKRIYDDRERYTIRDIEFLYLIEKYFGYFTRPEFILKIANKAFDIIKENRNKCRWSSEYGGDAWATISKTMLSRKNIVSKTIFVDTCWSLQHNTELFINKVYKDEDISLVRSYLTDIKNGIFKNVYNCTIEHNPKLNRFTYRNIILENDKSIPYEDHKYHEHDIQNRKRYPDKPEPHFFEGESTEDLFN